MSNYLEDVQVNNAANKRIAYLAYILYFLGIISLGIFSILGLILSYVRRKSCENSIFYSHFSHLIRIFWIFSGIQFLGLILLLAPAFLKIIGVIILIVVYIWYLYSLVSGFSKLSDNKVI